MTVSTCGARFYPANGETVTSCELPAGHADEQHKGWCLGSPCRWTGGPEESEEYVSGWEDTGTKPPLIVCGPCSEAGGAGMPVHHEPPECVL